MTVLSADSREDRHFVSFSSAQRSSYAAVGCFLLAVLFMVLAFAVADPEYERASQSYTLYKQLNATYLEKLWEHRRKLGHMITVSDMFVGLAFLFSIPPVSAFSESMPRGQAAVMTTAFTAGCGLFFLEFVFTAGLNDTSSWVSSWDVMKAAHKHHNDGGFGPLQSLEISYRIAQSHRLWIFTLDWLLIAIAKLEAAKLVFTNGAFSRYWAYLSVVGGILGCLTFLLECLKYIPGSWMVFTKIGGIFQLLDLLIFIVWTFWLGAQLGRVKDLRYSEQKDLLDTDASAGDSSAANNL